MSTPPASQPIWTRPEPGARRPRFSREQIAAAALAIADAEGFDAVSIRRIATVTPPITSASAINRPRRMRSGLP